MFYENCVISIANITETVMDESTYNLFILKSLTMAWLIDHRRFKG